MDHRISIVTLGVAGPDNFPWEVAFNPSFPIAEDGALHLPD
jgi:hypothetical protein